MTHHCIFAPVCQAVVHRDLFALDDVSDGYDNQPHLATTVDFPDAAVWWRMEKHGPPDATGSLLAQLGHTGRKKQHALTLETWIPERKNSLTDPTASGGVGGLLTRAEMGQAGSKDCQVGGGGLPHPLDTDYHLECSNQEHLYCFLTDYTCNYSRINLFSIMTLTQ